MDTASLCVVWGTIAILAIVTLLAAVVQAGLDTDVDAAIGEGDGSVPIRLSWSTGPRATADDDGTGGIANWLTSSPAVTAQPPPSAPRQTRP